eukprot:4066273-Prymnesium_polylepis.1
MPIAQPVATRIVAVARRRRPFRRRGVVDHHRRQLPKGRVMPRTCRAAQLTKSHHRPAATLTVAAPTARLAPLVGRRAQRRRAKVRQLLWGAAVRHRAMIRSKPGISPAIHASAHQLQRKPRAQLLRGCHASFWRVLCAARRAGPLLLLADRGLQRTAARDRTDRHACGGGACCSWAVCTSVIEAPSHPGSVAPSSRAPPLAAVSPPLDACWLATNCWPAPGSGEL